MNNIWKASMFDIFSEYFSTLPKPEENKFYSFGIHPVVCCPRVHTAKSIFFHSEPEHSEYKPIVSTYVLTDEERATVEATVIKDYKVFIHKTNSKVSYIFSFQISDDYCPSGYEFPGHGEISECVPLNQCPEVLENVRAPLNQTITCGFDVTKNLVKICCPPSLVKEPQNFAQPPRFPDKNGKPRDVDDKTKFCEKWSKNNACKLDREFNISVINYFAPVLSKDMFTFMQKSCMKTCGWAPKGKLTITWSFEISKFIPSRLL